MVTKEKINPRLRFRRNYETMVGPVRWSATKEGKEKIKRSWLNYIEAVNKSEGFDVGGLPLSLPPGYCGGVGLVETICDEDGCSRLAFLYAKMGLHRYNLLQGKNLQLSKVKRYNKSTACAASSYYITLEAMDPDKEDDSRLTFQTSVHEEHYGKLVLSCSIARPLGETKIGEIKNHKPLEKHFFLENAMPEWPSENPFRSYLLKKAELEDNYHWILLYLELAVATTNRHTAKNHDLSNLKILKVAIDTTSKEDLDEALNPEFVAILYIRYKDSCEARVGKDVDRIAIVRRFFNQRMGCFSLVGQNMSSEIIIPKKGMKKKKQSAQLRFKPWLKAYKYSPRSFKYVVNEPKRGKKATLV